MPIQTPIRGLRAFCVAAKCLSFKHAAEQLYVTPSAVSHQIKDLEQQLKCQLFVRKTRSIELTSVGYQFYKSVQPVMAQLESTIGDFTKQSQNKAISLSLPEFFASEILVPRLPAWAEQYPDIDLQLNTIKTNERSHANSDLSVVLSSSKPVEGKSTELIPIRYAAAVNKQLYTKWKNDGLDALNKVPLILHEARPWAWHQWADQQNVSNFEPKQIIQFNSMFSVARSAQQGLGIALVPLPVSKSWFASELLVKLFDNELYSNDKYFLVQHEFSKHRSEINVFVEWIKKQFAELA